MNRIRLEWLWVLVFGIFTPITQGAVIRIPADFPTIQAGLDAAQNGDTILLADGTYTGTGNTSLHWDGHDKHLVISSENGPAACVIDGQDLALIISLNMSGQNADDRIVGISFRHGQGPICGGIYCCGIGLSLENCLFEQCRSSSTLTGFGGALYCLDASLRMTDCAFVSNSSARDGGAVFSYNGTLAIETCQFSGNTSAGNGGVLHSIDSTLNVTSSIFLNNGGSGYWGGIYTESSLTSVTNCEFDGNTAERGGAIYCHLRRDDSFNVISLNGNRFGFNDAQAGTDLCASTKLSSGRIQAKNCQFHYHPQSDFCVSPKATFLLSGYTSETTPIQTDVYVSPSGSDENDGLTADTPFKTIRHALERLLGNTDDYVTIYLAPGRYSPSSTGEQFPLPLVEYISLRGDSEDASILDAEDGSRLLYGFFEQLLSISNLAFLGGNSDSYGGGLATSETNVYVSQCVFSDNTAYGGGGAYLATGSTDHFYLCDFDHNTSDAIGGAVFIRDSAPSFQACTFQDNSCTGQGGGIARISSSTDITDCMFISNSAADGGGLYSLSSDGICSECSFDGNTGYDGGGIYTETSSNQFTDCLIRNNSATYGGGFFSYTSLDSFVHCTVERNHAQNGAGGIIGKSSKTSVRRCTFSHNQAEADGGGLIVRQSGDPDYPLIMNCLMESNTAGNNGGAIRIENDSDATIMNATFSANEAGQNGGGISVSSANDVSVTNSIVWNNSPAPIHTEDADVTVSFSDISGGHVGVSNIDADPSFVGPGDYRLNPGSPCIDAGTDENAPEVDIDGNYRSQCGSADIGAYEFYAGPADSRVYIKMPAHLFYPGMRCSCRAIIWNAVGTTISDHPFFVVLEILGEYYFAPDFNEFGLYRMDFPPGETSMFIIPTFDWPADVGEFSGARWYAGLTNPEMNQLLWNLASWEFGWSQ